MPKLAGHSFVGERARHTDPLHAAGCMQRVRLGSAGFRPHLVITRGAPGRLDQMLCSAPGICSIDAAECRNRYEAHAHRATWVAPHEASPLGRDLRAHHPLCSFMCA
jgi:hypothetical protein